MKHFINTALLFACDRVYHNEN